MNLRVKFPSLATQPIVAGGPCQSDCYDDFSYVVMPISEWVEYTVPFSLATQEGGGTPAGSSPKAWELLRIEFQTSGALAGTSFDFCIDDVTFY